MYTKHCGVRQRGHRIEASLGYIVPQAYTHEMRCWNILQKEKCIVQRVDKHCRAALTLQSTTSLCSSQLFPIPSLAAVAAAALQRNVSMCDP